MHALVHGAWAAVTADDLRDALLFAAPHGRGGDHGGRSAVGGSPWARCLR